MNNEIELKPCPFCGNGKVRYFKGFTIYQIICENCGAIVSFMGKEKKDKTGQAWNRRADNDKHGA